MVLPTFQGKNEALETTTVQGLSKEAKFPRGPQCRVKKSKVPIHELKGKPSHRCEPTFNPPFDEPGEDKKRRVDERAC